MPSEPFDHAPELSEHASDPSKHASELLKHASELSEHVSELFIWLLELSTLEARVCQKDVRSSSKKNSKSPSCVKCAHLGSERRNWSHVVLDLVNAEELSHFEEDEVKK